MTTPCCPICGSPPVFVLDGGRQSFCGNDECHVILWDATLPLDELLTGEVGVVRAEGLG